MTIGLEPPDRRALGLPDHPYSAYCKVCWQAIYSLWIEAEDHGGVCPFGAKQIGDCAQASSWERMKGEIKKYLSPHPTGDRTNDA